MHNTPHTEETKRKISKANTGRKLWPNGRKGVRLNTGRTHFKKGNHYSPSTEFKKGNIPWCKGEKRPDFIPWNKGQKGQFKHSKEIRKKISQAGIGRKFSKATIKRMSENQKGPKGPNWKGGRGFVSGGYVKIYVNGIYILEHRYVMQQMIKRPLTRKDIVHHKNGNRSDNRRKNLELIIAPKDGNNFHHGKVLCPFCSNRFGIK